MPSAGSVAAILYTPRMEGPPSTGAQCGRRSCQHTPGLQECAALKTSAPDLLSGIYFARTISLEYSLVLPEQDQDSTSYCHLVAKLHRHKIDVHIAYIYKCQKGFDFGHVVLILLAKTWVVFFL